MITFAEPQWLNLCWAAGFLLVIAWILESARQTKIQKHMGKKIGAFLSASSSINKKRWHIILQSLALGFFGLALARPQLGTSQSEVKQTGVELIIAVDVSTSMLAEDEKPSRLSHAKNQN